MTGDAMAAASVSELCALRGLAAGRAIRERVYAMPIGERGRPDTAALKPGGVRTQHVDRAAEDEGIRHLEQLAGAIDHRIVLLTDPARGGGLSLGRSSRAEVVFAHLDAVDGTIKIGGLGNDLDGGRVRLANDGTWGVALAFSAPTRRAPEALTYRDFSVALVVDGNPPRRRAFPHEVVALPGRASTAVALDLSDAPAVLAALRRAAPVFTTTNQILSQSVVYWDAFQAFDRATHAAGDEALVPELYRELANRHDGGPYDIVRQYGNLSALLRVMLGWRGALPWHESQGAGFVVVNENLPNLIPAVPIVAAAGGISVDLDDRPLLDRRLSEGRTSVVHAANEAMRGALLHLVARARARMPT